MKFELLSFVLKETGQIRNKIITATVAAGLANGLVMVIINNVAKDYHDIDFINIVLFFMCMGIFVTAKRYSLYETESKIQKAISNKHLTIIDKLRKSSLVQYEKLGKIGIVTNISENSEIIFESSRMIVSAMSAAVMLTFSFLYIAYLSTSALWMSIIIILLGVFAYQFNQKSIMALYAEFQQKDAAFFESLNHFLDGFKEVKINRERSDDIYFNEFRENVEQADDVKLRAEKKFITNTVFTQILFFMLMAFIVFLLPQMDGSKPETIVSITSVILFIAAPVGILVDSMPIISKANMALKNILRLEDVLDKASDYEANGREDFPADFGELSIRQLNYNYMDDVNNKMFSLGPIDVSMKPGDLTFIVGGNGSGKTTLLKNLIGLYYPHSGSITVGDEPIASHNYGAYRNLFSIVLTDFHLFDKIYGLKDLDETKVNALIRKMQIDHKTAFKNGKFTNLNLSTGQRKRIALIVALMEDKPIMIFDEVAADQDPEFRQYFYYEFLPELKRNNKTVIAVSHDDRYFDVADRVIKMEYGKIAAIETKGTAQPGGIA